MPTSTQIAGPRTARTRRSGSTRTSPLSWSARPGVRGRAAAWRRGAAFHERAVELTPDPRRRARRALLAAKGKHQAGANDAALRLLAMAQAGPLERAEQARAQLLHAQITFAMTRGSDAPPLLLEAAKRLEPLDPRLARETYLEAFATALSTDRLGRGWDAREVAGAVLAADWEPSGRAYDLLLDGLALLVRDGYVAGAPALTAALRAFRDEPLSEEEGLRWLWVACHIARALGDYQAWDELTARHLELARRAGAFSLLSIALSDRVVVEIASGRMGAATSLAAEADAVVEATGSHLVTRASIMLANWRGRDAEALALIEARKQDVLRRGEGLWLVANEYGSVLRYNGLGRYEEALAAAERVAEDPRGLGLWIRDLFELIEAAVRSGHPERATGPLAKLGEIAHAASTDWALGSHHARSAAMLAEGETAERLYREAIERFSRTRGSESLARAHLLYGEWLRREHRRVDAREQHESLTRCSWTGAWRHLPSAPAASTSHRRDGAQADRRDARRADPTRAAGRAPGCRRADEPGDRRPAVPQPAHRGVAPGRRCSQSSGSARARSSARRYPTSAQSSHPSNSQWPRSRSCSSPTNSTHRARSSTGASTKSSPTWPP